MALVTLLSIPMSSISLCIIGLMAGTIVWAEECERSCGYIGPITYTLPNQTCLATGDKFELSIGLNWNDGTYSAYTIQVNTQIVIGSCCYAFKSSFYGTTIVSSGRFSGEKLIVSFDLSDYRQTCNRCQSSAGLSRVTGGALLSIGTKGVGNWIECTGSTTLLFSPALTSTPQKIYPTLVLIFSDCSDCVKSC